MDLLSLDLLLEHFRCVLHRPPSDPLPTVRFAPLESASRFEAAFLVDSSYLKKLRCSSVSLLVTHESMLNDVKETGFQGGILLHEAPYELMVEVLSFLEQKSSVSARIHSTALIAESAVIGKNVTIGPFVVVGDQTVIGDDSELRAHVVVGKGVQIGCKCLLKVKSFVGDACVLGHECVLGEQSVVGSEGFGYVDPGRKNLRIPHLGAVKLGDRVEVGALTALDRSTFPGTFTHIGSGTKIDNLVQIAHNVKIGENCIIAGQTGLAGSVVLEDGVVCGGQVAFSQNCVVGKGSWIYGRSGVTKNLPSGVYMGVPAEDHLLYKKKTAKINKMLES